MRGEQSERKGIIYHQHHRDCDSMALPAGSNPGSVQSAQHADGSDHRELHVLVTGGCSHLLRKELKRRKALKKTPFRRTLVRSCLCSHISPCFDGIDSCAYRMSLSL